MRKMVSLLLFLVMIMYTSSISFADENNDNIESIVESHSSEKNDVDINSSETDNVSIMDKNNKSDKVLNNTAVEDKENIVNNMTEDELEAYHVTLDQNEFSKIQDEEVNVLNAEDSNYETGWVSCGTMTSARSYMASAVVNNQIYTFGGQENGVAVRTSERFLTSKEIWYRCTPMPKSRYKHTALAIGEKIYLCAGYDANEQAVSDIYVYNTISDSWDDPISTPNNNTNYASIVYGGELYIISGFENGESSKKIYKYNTQSETWSYITSIKDEFVDAKVVVYESNIVVFDGADMYIYDSQDFHTIDTHRMIRELVDYAVISRDFKNLVYIGYLPAGETTMGFYVTGGHPENSDISTATTSAFYSGGGFYVSSGWTYDLRLIRGLACHNMVEANGYIYIFGGQVTKGTDQKLMFKRSVEDRIDDVPDTVELKNGAVVGSINGYGDVDSFTITPKKTSIYSFRTYTYWYGLEFSLKYGNKQLGVYYDQGGVDKYSYGLDRLLEEGKTYTIHVSVPLSYDSQWGEYAFAYVPVNDDVPNYFDEAQKIKINTNYSRNFEGIDDIDCFKFNVTDLGKYNISVTGSSHNSMKYSIYSESDTENDLYRFSTASDNTVENKIQLAPGNYYIKFQGSGGTYKFSLNHIGNIYHLFEDRCKHQMTTVGNKIYALGGLNNSFNNISDIEVYDPEQKEWSVEMSELDINSSFSAISIDDSIYLVGGRRSNGEFSKKIQKYNPLNQTFSSIGELNIARERSGLAVLGNDIYVAGGRNEYGYLKTIEVYNVETNSVSRTLELPFKIVDPQIYFIDDTLYVMAGADETGFSNKVYALDDDVWVEKSSMPYTSEYVRGDVYDGNFYCAATNEKENVDILKYNTVNDEWAILKENFVESKIYYDTAILNGMLYITGGYSITDDTVTDSVNSIDIVTDIASMDRAIPIRTIGFEFEQKINDSVINAPEIIGVNAKTIDADKGIYELYLNEDDYISDVRSIPFFFWSAREGMFSALSEDYRRVMFYADPNTGNRKVKIVVGIGDARGYVDKKAFNLTGNSVEE